MKLKTTLAAGTALLAIAISTGAALAEFPERPVEIVVPWPPGDLEDVVARMISDQIQDDYGVPSAVVNQPGGGGVIGATNVWQSGTDGYTIGMFTGNILTAHIIAGRAPFGADAFAPVGIAINYPMALWVRADLPVHDMAELARYAQDNGVSLGHFGFNGPPTRQTLLAAQTLGFEFAGSAAFDETNCNTLASGDADVVVSTVQLMRACLDSGEARPIAAYTSARIGVLPDVATLEEQVPGVAAPAWAGLFVPAGTPQEVIDRIAASAERAMQSEAMANLAETTGAVLEWMPGQAAAEYVTDQYSRVETLMSQ
jgi:tripartite-type tricarboxylate transporter receptor subunit TctC